MLILCVYVCTCFLSQGCLQDLIISFKEKAIAKQCPKAHIGMQMDVLYDDIIMCVRFVRLSL